MYLKSLTLKGFKSFADRTTLAFDPGLTVVVGPNGSGKSNVSDAILWVLGEQSAKQLRGQAMEDVIFSGSSARPAVGVAEVTLVLDNSDHRLPVDFDEVAVTRRMYRSGESEYLINSAPARLMDIQDILHDSGLGKETHSIISQGKLDAVLASRPEDRRELIEEAAGISKHRRRRERSQRKLKAMEDDVRRARDLDREIRRRLRPLERQVDKAKRFEDLDARRRDLEAVLAVDDLRRLKAKWDDVSEWRRQAAAAVEIAGYRADERSAELEKLQSLLEQKGLFVGDLGEQRRRVQDQLGRIESDMRLLEEKGRNMVAKLSDTRMSLSSLERQRSQAAADLDASQAELDEAEARRGRLDAAMADLGPAADEAEQARRRAEEALGEATRRARAARKANDAATLERARIQERTANAAAEDAMFGSRISQIDEGLGADRKALDALRADLADREHEAAAARRDLEAAVSAIGEYSRALSEARRGHDKAENELRQASARLDALRSIQAPGHGASGKAQALAGRGRDEGLVTSTLAAILRAPEDLSVLVETLTAPYLEALVVVDDDAVTSLGQVALADKAAGSVTLVPASPTHPKAAEGELPGYSLAERVASHFPDCPASELALLAPVRVVDSLEEAVAAHNAHPTCVFATPEGAVVDREGLCSVGMVEEAGRGTIARNEEIRSLERSLAALEEDVAERGRAVAAARRSLDGARADQDSARGRVSRLDGEADSLRRETSRLEDRIKRAEAERADVSERRTNASAKVSADRERLAALEEQCATSAAELDEATSEGAGLEEARDCAASAAAEARDKANGCALELATVNERKRHLATRVSSLADQLRRIDDQRESAVSGTRSLEVLRLRVDPLHERYEAVRDAARAWAARLRDRASLAEADNESLKKTIGDARGASEAARKELEGARQALGTLEVEAGKLEVQVEAAVAAVGECAPMPLEEALELPEPDDRGADEAELDKVRRQIKNLGPVNQVAMEEYAELKERADYIAGQLADLERAKGALDKICSAIDRKMRRAFVDTFERVNENFKEVFALLFPGGSAYLEMTDPDHPSETGIEIVAQPKGKRIPKLALMSGGEKSLTALAVLFAVYRTRTVPFYVFDEVEAALDDANLDKLLDAIEHLVRTTQLIVISHQRRTMEQADVLYGVSMQADGVSHVISQRLDRKTGKVVDA